MADLTHDTADDGFHEIQLSGKQLVFLFMATTVISVVIFLCGVLVGRNVQAEALADDTSIVAAAEPDATPALTREPIAADPPSPPAEEGLTYTGRLEGAKEPEKLKAPEEDTTPVRDIPAPAAEAPAPPVGPPPAPRPADKEPAAPSSASTGPRPGTWAVQVISLRDRSAAQQIVRRLSGKGFPAFLVAPTPGAPTQVYKVQVGRYDDRAEAQKVGARLKKEEQLDTWIVR